MIKISKSTALGVALIGAAVVGAGTTALVSAAIPSTADGKISACYRNAASLTDAKGALRVIDKHAGQNCSNNETALNWSSTNTEGVSAQVAYTFIQPNRDPETEAVINGPALMDSDRTKNIVAVTYFKPTGNDAAIPGGYCITVNFEPKNIQLTSKSPNSFIDGRGITAVKNSAGVWSSTGGPERVCATVPAANAYIGNGGSAWNDDWFVRLEK